MRETSVLHTAAVEELAFVVLQSNCRLCVLEMHRGTLLKGNLACSNVCGFHQSRSLTYVELNSCSCDCEHFVALLYLELLYCIAWIVDKNLRIRVTVHGLRVANDAPSVVLEHTENVVAVEVKCYSLVAVQTQLNCCGVNLYHALHFRGIVTGCLRWSETCKG